MAKRNGADKKSSFRYIPCRAEPGMFRGELLVYLEGLHPEDCAKVINAQLLVDEHEVKIEATPRRNSPVAGWLQVSLAHEESGIAEVILPQPAQPVGESLLVKASSLRKVV